MSGDACCGAERPNQKVRSVPNNGITWQRNCATVRSIGERDALRLPELIRGLSTGGNWR